MTNNFNEAAAWKIAVAPPFARPNINISTQKNMNYGPSFFARRDTDYKASDLQFPGKLSSQPGR